MPYKKPNIEKIYFSIGEVADLMNVNPSHIRYWENKFDILKPYKNKKGNRLFTKVDIENIKLINYLVKTRGMTIKGAQKKLKENKEETFNNFEIVDRLQNIRAELIDIKNAIEE